MSDPPRPVAATRTRRRHWGQVLGDLWVTYFAIGLLHDVFLHRTPAQVVLSVVLMALVVVAIKMFLVYTHVPSAQPRYAIFTHDTPEGTPPPGMES